MSNSDVLVHVRAKDTCAELYLLDDQRALVASGLGDLTAKVPPGFYKISQRIGDVERSEIIDVSDDSASNVVELEPLKFPSPIPLVGTTTTREFQQAAIGFSDVTHSFGGSATFFLMVRDPRWKYGQPDSQPLQFLLGELARLSFESFSGDIRLPLQQLGRFDGNAGWFIAHIVLQPDTYVLVQKDLSDPKRQVCLPLEVTDTWSPQVFLQIAPVGSEGLELQLDRASVVYALHGQHLSPNDPDLLLLEVARKALTRGRSQLAPDVMDRIVNSKYHDPMLGLFGAHLLLDGPKPDHERAALVIRNTEAILGTGFPDIVALRCRLARAMQDPSAGEAFPILRGPPLLAASWAALINAGPGGSASVADNSPALRFSFTVADTSTWFIWREAAGVRVPSAPTENIFGDSTGTLTRDPFRLPDTTFFGGSAAIPYPPTVGNIETGIGEGPEPSTGDPFATPRSRGRSGIDGRDVQYEMPASPKAVTALLEQLLAQPGLHDWVRSLRAQERAGRSSDDLTQFDKGLLSSAASAQSSLLPGVLDIKAAAAAIAQSINVPSAIAQKSLTKLLGLMTPVVKDTTPEQSVDLVFLSAVEEETSALMRYLRSLSTLPGRVRADELSASPVLGAFRSEQVVSAVLRFGLGEAYGSAGDAVQEALGLAPNARCVIGGALVSEEALSNRIVLERMVRDAAKPPDQNLSAV